MFLSLQGIHTLQNCLMNLRSPPVITSSPGNWSRVISPLVVLVLRPYPGKSERSPTASTKGYIPLLVVIMPAPSRARQPAPITFLKSARNLHHTIGNVISNDHVTIGRDLNFSLLTLLPN